MSNMMCTACGKVGEPYQRPACEQAECPAHGFVRMLGALADPREAAFNELNATAVRSGVVPTPLDWFKAGIHHALRNSGVEEIDGPRRGPEADGSQKPNDAAAIPCAKAGSNTDARGVGGRDGETFSSQTLLPPK